MLAGLVYRGNMVTLPVYMEENANVLTGWLNQQSWIGVDSVMGKGGSEKTLGATLLMSLAFLIGIAGQKIGGFVADRYDLRKAYFTFFALALPVTISMAFLEGWGLVAAATLFVILTLGMQPVENSLVAMLTPTQWRARAYGMKFILTFGVGACAVWVVTGVREMWGTPVVYLALGGIVVLLLTSIVGLMVVSRGISMRH